MRLQISQIFAVLVAASFLRLAAQQSAPPGPEPIQVAQIVIRGEDLSSTLREVALRLPPDSELAEFEAESATLDATLRTSRKESTNLLAGKATITEIREQIREWAAYDAIESPRRKTLNAWGSNCEQSLALLKTQEGVWLATLKSIRELGETGFLVTRVRQFIRDIQTAIESAERRLRTVVKLQDSLSKQSTAVADILDKLSLAKQHALKRVFYPDAGPIWRQAEESQSEPNGEPRHHLDSVRSNLAAFLKERRSVIGATILLMILALGGILWLTRAAIPRQPRDPAIRQVSLVLRRPISLAVLLASPVILISLPLVRMNVALTLLQVFLLPTMRLLPLYSAHTPRLIYFFGVFCALNGWLGIADLDIDVKRRLLALLFTAALCVLCWWARPKRFCRAENAAPSRREVLILRSSIAALTLILCMNILGFVVLANLVRVAVLLSCYLGLVIHTFVLTADTLLATVLRSGHMSTFAATRLHPAGITTWAKRVLHVAALAAWIYVTLDLLALKDRIFLYAERAFNARLSIRALSISLGDAVAVLTVVLGGYLIANAVRFVLREEIFYRMRLPRGIPEVISNLIYYVLLVVVGVMSLSAMGLQLDKLTVVTGALGVGVGFGLQGLVNNFVSGLILQCERPIRVGDVLEVGTLSGEVRRIGIRSSTVRTFQGAEVIIPNATLVSGQVINWTLSEARRRVEVTVGVAYGTEPACVIALLTGVAASHPEVRPDPAPAAFFQGFGPNAMDFILMFWAEQDTHFRLRSEVSIAVNAALRKAGIEIPFPRHDIRLRREPPSPAPKALTLR